MGKLDLVAGVWKNLQELDLRPLREAARREVRIAVVGGDGSGKRALAAQMCTDPAHRRPASQPALLLAQPEGAGEATNADLIILMLAGDQDDHPAERALAQEWGAAGKRVLVCYNESGQASGAAEIVSWAGWSGAQVVSGAVDDRQFLEDEFAAAVLRMLPDRQLALARQYPLFRLPVARRLINDTCMANTTYALGTGIAEIVPVLDLPLNVTDMLVLTKGQALLVYKLGLALGLPEDWQYYLTEFGGVIGSGFLWRQLARSLVGLIPGWGILPKVGIAYAGTYVVGEVVLQWYLTGRHVSPEQMRDLYRRALLQGKALAGRLIGERRRVRLPAISLPSLPRPRVPRLGLLKRQAAKPAALQAPPREPVCSQCGTQNEADAVFCKHCGHPVAATGPSANG